jgi:hypothetical protein
MNIDNFNKILTESSDIHCIEAHILVYLGKKKQSDLDINKWKTTQYDQSQHTEATQQHPQSQNQYPEYINNTYNYEFIIRTNLSTVFHIPNLLEYLYIIPNTNSCGGFNYRSFITGTGIFLTRDVANQIVENFLKYDITKFNEDIIISGLLNKFKTPYYNCKQFYKWCLVIDEQTENYGEYFWVPTNGQFKDFDFPENILQFRIKNTLDRNVDILYFKLLLKKIYDIVV